jgi:KRAB domain-containing zinc finger protein
VVVCRFKESTHLRKHLYTHTGERPHFCSYCAKGFQTSSDLKRHKKTRVHQERVDQCNTTIEQPNNTTSAESQSEKSKRARPANESFCELD